MNLCSFHVPSEPILFSKPLNSDAFPITARPRISINSDALQKVSMVMLPVEGVHSLQIRHGRYDSLGSIPRMRISGLQSKVRWLLDPSATEAASLVGACCNIFVKAVSEDGEEVPLFNKLVVFLFDVIINVCLFARFNGNASTLNTRWRRRITETLVLSFSTTVRCRNSVFILYFYFPKYFLACESFPVKFVPP